MLQFTDRAREMVLAFLGQGDGEFEALRIEETDGGSPVAAGYELTLVGGDEADPEDVPVDGGGFKVLVEKNSAEGLEGATVDYVQRDTEAGFEVRPAATQAPEAGERSAGNGEGPTGELAEKVQDVLDNQVNPAVASHGGFIRLVDVDGTEIYMEMGGGCQGCALSRMTLRQGVERMLRQHVPEISAVHDVTDHEAGEDPFY